MFTLFSCDNVRHKTDVAFSHSLNVKAFLVKLLGKEVRKMPQKDDIRFQPYRVVARETGALKNKEIKQDR